MTTTNLHPHRILWVSMLSALVGLVVYLVTSFTGFLAGTRVGMEPIVCTIIAIALLMLLTIMGHKLPSVWRDLVVIGVAALVITAFSTFAMARVSLVADVYFIPVNYPANEETALYLSIVGLIFYGVSILTMILHAFFGRDGE